MARRVLKVGEKERRRYADEGFFVIDSFFDAGVVEALRAECDKSVAFIDGAMDDMGVDTYGLNHRRQRYIYPQQYKKSDVLPGILFSEPMADICRATLGQTAYLLIEQFVVKGPRCGLELGRHQDAGYIPFDFSTYATVWIPLDDVDQRNGTLYFLPYSRAGTRRRVEHRFMPESHDKVGYFGDDPGIPVVAPAGSIAVTSSTTFHRSGANITESPRRAYIAQYSAEPMMNPDGSGPRHFADPFLRQGKIVPQPDLAELKQAPNMIWAWTGVTET